MKDPLDISSFRTTIGWMYANKTIEPNSLLDEQNREKVLSEKVPIESLARFGSLNSEKWLAKFITIDPDMIELKDKCRLLAHYNEPVLIIGETGTGKELLARALHGFRGPNKEGTAGHFVAINCPALSVDLMESELFGHVAGAFTGSIKDRAGKFSYAYKGTLFIDEIGDMPPSMQAAILRVLQENVIIRVGDNKEIPVIFRLVCATNKNLQEMISNGTFREDLYYRISTFILQTIPLRGRPNDIPLIIDSLDKDKLLPADFTKHWTNLKLKGNVRELQQLVRRYQIFKQV